MNLTGVSNNVVTSLQDTESTQPASHAKGTDDTHVDATNSAFAATLAAMMNMSMDPTAKLPAAKPEGMDSELEQTAGEIAGRSKGSDRDTNADRATRGNTTVNLGMNAMPTGAGTVKTDGTAMKTAPLVSSNTLEVTVDDNFRPANPASTSTSTSIMTPRLLEGGKPESDATASELSAEATPVAGTHTRAAANVAAKSDVHSVNNDTDALNPEFRTRLNRVINRMRDEYGHSVDVVEGYRPQERQNHLYEQGRSRPGDVVTWTKSSKHTLGMAADLKIDGSYNNPDGYKHLAQIAAQEGLRTLGSRDPGHVELPTRAGSAAWGAPADTTAHGARFNESVSRAMEIALGQSGQSLDGDSSPTSSNVDSFNSFMSRSVRTTGDSVRVMQSGQGMGSELGGGGMSQGGFNQNGFSRQNMARNEMPSMTQDSLAQSTLVSAAAQRARQDRGTASVAAIAEPAQVAPVAQVAQVATVAQVAGVANVASSPHASSGSATGSASAASTVSTAERVGKILDVRDASQARPLSHMTLTVDNANGGTDRIRVDVRGSAVHTTISAGDHVGADKMSLRTGELQNALERQGLESGSIRVATSSAQTGAGGNQHQGNGSNTQDQEPNQNRGHARQDADDLHQDAQRQRSRRDQKGGK